MKKMFLTIPFLLIANGVRAQVTPAAGYTPPNDTPAFKVGATIFTDYTYQNSPKIQDADRNVETRTVDAHIRNLRKKIGAERIATVVGFGYRYDPPQA